LVTARREYRRRITELSRLTSDTICTATPQGWNPHTASDCEAAPLSRVIIGERSPPRVSMPRRREATGRHLPRTLPPMGVMHKYPSIEPAVCEGKPRHGDVFL